MQIEKSKKQQAYEQAYEQYQKKHKRWSSKYKRVTEAEPDQADYDWRLQYFNQFEALSKIFEKLRSDYMKIHEKKNVFKHLSEKNTEDHITEALDDVSYFFADLTGYMRNKMFGKKPIAPDISHFNDDGTERGIRQILTRLKEDKQ